MQNIKYMGIFKTNWLEQVDSLVKEAKALKNKYRDKISFTCCNIEVNLPKGSEIMCPSCKEYCKTKTECGKK